MGTSKIKLVVFDWNGTLIADVQAMVDGVNAGFKALGYASISKKKYKEAFRMPIKESYISMGISRKDIETRHEEVANAFHDYYEERALKIRTRRGARQVLEYLKERKIKAAILSNHTKSGIASQLVRLKISKYFDAVLANDNRYASTFEGKQLRLLKYLSEGHYKPSECVIVGDTVEEIEIGKDLAITTVAITGGITLSRLRLSEPDHIIHNLRQLFDILKK